MPKDIKTKAAPMKATNNERPANLQFWFGNGMCGSFEARVAADVKVSIGRTDSERALGFIVRDGERHTDFVLDRDQVVELAAFLHGALPGLRKPLGRKPKQQLSLAPLAELARREAMKPAKQPTKPKRKL